MSMNLPCIGSARTPYGLASIHVGRYPIGGAVHVELYTADDGLPEPLATLSCNLTPSGVALADDEFCVKSWSENEPLIEPMLATGLFEDTGRRTRAGYAVSPTWRIKDPQFVPPRR
jgi:hypothetical protein